jgi:putative membrane protein
MNRSIPLVTVASALLALLPTVASAAMTVPAVDATFAKKAAQAGMTEVKLSVIAERKSKNPAVLSFAREMNADHSKANAELTSIVEAKGLQPPTGVGAHNAALISRLEGESGATFDADYLKSQLPAHRKVLALFKSEAATGNDPELMAFAKQTIPVLEHHIAMDRRDSTRLGAIGMQMPTSK